MMLETMQGFCQCVLVAVIIVRFLGVVAVCFNGREALSPLGMPGFVFVTFIVLIELALFYGAGCFSLLLGPPS